MFIEI